jgi:hypothetical protein
MGVRQCEWLSGGVTRDWKITVHAADGAGLRHCMLKARKLACA